MTNGMIFSVSPEGYIIPVAWYIDVETGEMVQSHVYGPGKIPCDGRSVPRSQHQKLFEFLNSAGLIAEQDEDSFTVPDVYGRVLSASS